MTATELSSVFSSLAKLTISQNTDIHTYIIYIYVMYIDINVYKHIVIRSF